MPMTPEEKKMNRAAEIRIKIEEIKDDLRCDWDDDLACELVELKDELKDLEG